MGAKEHTITIKKVKMPTHLLLFGRGYGWEVRNNETKKILDVLPTKKQAINFKRQQQ